MKVLDRFDSVSLTQNIINDLIDMRLYVHWSQMDSIKKREFIMPRLLEFVRRHKITLLFITHEIAMMKEMDHILVLEGMLFISLNYIYEYS